MCFIWLSCQVDLKGENICCPVDYFVETTERLALHVVDLQNGGSKTGPGVHQQNLFPHDTRGGKFRRDQRQTRS